MPRRPLLAAIVLTASLLGPAVAGAQQTPFAPLPPAPPEQAPPPQAATEDEGLSPQQQMLIAVAGIVLLVGIGWAIVRDARRRAPVDEGRVRAADGAARPKGTRPPPVRRAAQSRAKAKSARQARKRNR